MKQLIFIFFILTIATPSVIGQNYAGNLTQTCSAFTNKEATFEDTPYVTESITVELEWLYCGPWNGNDFGNFYVDIWVNDSWQDLHNTSDSGNGCSWVSTSFSVTASVWNSAIQSNDGSVLIRAYITDSCSPGVGCSFSNDPCFRGNVDYDYEPFEAAEANFQANTAEVCTNQLVSLTDLSLGSDLEYTWELDGGELISDFDGVQTISYDTPGNKNISLTVSNFQGESTQSVTILVNPSPAISVSEDEALCFGSITLLEVEGSGDILWSDGLESIPSVEVSPVESQMYYVSLTNEFQCATQDSVYLEVLPLPLVDAGENTSICAGESVLLSGTGEGTLTWSNDALAEALQTVFPDQSTTYILDAVGENNCTSSDEVTITVNEIPVANAGLDVELCLDESTALSATGGNTYFWDNSLGEGPSHSISPSETTDYIVMVMSTENCSDTDTLTVTVNPIPVIDITENTAICFGEETTISVTGEGEIQWNNDLGTESSYEITPELTTSYEAEITNEFDCSAAASVLVTVHPQIETSITGLSTDPYCSVDENAYNMIGTPSGGDFTGNGVSGNQFTPANAGIGQLEITYIYTDEFSCEHIFTSTAEVDICENVEELNLEFNLFPSPVNDELTISGASASEAISQIQVFDYSGRLVLDQEINESGTPLKINLSTLKSGNYILNLIGENWNTSYSIIKE